MCLILFAYKVHSTYPLIVAANRDEQYRRPTAPAHYWEDEPNILAGRDLEKMGTWMGVTTEGRFAALTNYRNPKETVEGKRSRGQLVSEALSYKGKLMNFMKELSDVHTIYPGYNLLAGNVSELYYYSNIGQKLRKLDSGIYGLSNHLLDTSWPKVVKGKVGLKEIITTSNELAVEELFSLLANTDQAPDENLPKTGVSLDMERKLSPLFIQSEGYGTRSSTVLLMNESEARYYERTFQQGKNSTQQFTIRF